MGNTYNLPLNDLMSHAKKYYTLKTLVETLSDNGFPCMEYKDPVGKTVEDYIGIAGVVATMKDDAPGPHSFTFTDGKSQFTVSCNLGIMKCFAQSIKPLIVLGLAPEEDMISTPTLVDYQCIAGAPYYSTGDQIMALWNECMQRYETCVYRGTKELHNREEYTTALAEKRSLSLWAMHPLGNLRIELEPMSHKAYIKGSYPLVSCLCRTMGVRTEEIKYLKDITNTYVDPILEKNLVQEAQSTTIRWSLNYIIRIAWINALISVNSKPRLVSPDTKGYLEEVLKTNKLGTGIHPILSWYEGEYWNVDPNGPLASVNDCCIHCEGQLFASDGELRLRTYDTKLMGYINGVSPSGCAENLSVSKIYSVPKHLMLSLMGICFVFGDPRQMDKSILKAIQDKVYTGPVEADILWGKVAMTANWDSGKVKIEVTRNLASFFDQFMDFFVNQFNAPPKASFIDDGAHTSHFFR